MCNKNVFFSKDKEDNSEFENIISAFLVTKKNPLLTKIKDNKEKIADLSRERPSSLSVKREGVDHFLGANKKINLKRIMTLKKGSAAGEKRMHKPVRQGHLTTL